MPGLPPRSCVDWQVLNLKCSVTQEKLSDPAYCVDCKHPAMVNYVALLSFVSAHHACPVAGCPVSDIRRIRGMVVRDERLRQQVCCWKWPVPPVSTRVAEGTPVIDRV